MNLQELLVNPPKIHSYQGELISSWKIADEELLFLDKYLTKNMKTLETGAGISTIVFALKDTNHTCIMPDEKQVERIKSYCTERDLSLSNTNFIVDKSEYALPSLKEKNYDLALIDGRHGFPAPFIDWFYIADRLKIGGLLIIDDLHIWTSELLKQFLLTEKEWNLVEETNRAATFVKLEEGSQHKEWTKQNYVLSRSRNSSKINKLGYLLNLLRQGKFSLFFKFFTPSA
jgi:Methyltransferase domain